MDTPSVLRVAGLAVGLLGLGLLLRRRERLLTRGELVLGLLCLGVVALAVAPELGSVLAGWTGFTGELRRITSVLTFAVLALFALVIGLQAAHEELRQKFFEYLRRAAVDSAQLTQGLPPSAAVVAVMPAFNEAENLAHVLGGAPREVLGQRVQVVVVDDGSTDDTAAVARAGGAWVIQNPVNAGGGHALKVGFLAAQRMGAPWVVTLDADGQHRWDDLPAIVEPLISGEADLVIGSRFLGASVGHEVVRAVGLRVFNQILGFLTGRRVTDCSSGMRGLATHCLPKLRLIQIRHHTAEMIIEASRRGLRVKEVPITILPRIHGESKKGANWLYGVRFGWTVLSSWWRR